MAYLEGRKVRLRAMEPEDLELLYTMENNPETWDISNITVPYSRYVLRQYLEESQADIFADRQMRLMIVSHGEEIDGAKPGEGDGKQQGERVVGTIDLFDYQPMHARSEVGIGIQLEYRRRGYATEALRLLCDYVFNFLHVKQLTAHVAVNNQASLRLFASCGFRECGLLREWWRVGETYTDVLLLQCLRP